jgi:hypothetical protein
MPFRVHFGSPCPTPPAPQLIAALVSAVALAKGKKTTVFYPYSPQFLDRVESIHPIKGKLLRESFPFILTKNGGIEKSLAVLMFREFQNLHPLQVA